MKFLKGLLIFLVIVVLIIVVVTFFLPSKAEMQRSQVIDAPPSVVFKQVNDLEKWEAWSPWHELDTNMVLEYSSENPVGEGESYSWNGNDDVGSGSLTILKSNPHNLIQTEMIFMESEDPAISDWIFEEVNGGTKVTWTFESEMSGASKWFGLMMDSFLGPQYERGLKNLESVATSLPTFEVEKFNLDDTWYIGYMIETDQAGVSDSQHYARGLGAVSGFIGQNEIQMAGAPMSIVHQFEPEKVIMEMAIPVADSIAVPDSLTIGKIPAGPALKTVHMGSYDNLNETWEAFEEYNQKNNVEVRWYPFEIYVNDPSTVEESEVITEIVFPVN